MKLYPPHAASLLGFGLVQDFLREQVLSALGEDALSSMRPAATLDAVRTRLGRVAEMQAVLQGQHALPFEEFLDVRSTLDQLEPFDAYVSGTALWEVRRVCRAMRRVRQWVVDSEHVLLRQVVRRITVLRALEDHLESVLLPGGEVRSDASPALHRIRRRRIRCQEALRSKLRSVLQDAVKRGYATELQPTVRAGRMVVPIRAEAKRKVKGFVHGTSATGQTVYVEPAACLELNNELRLLEEEERREVVRLLRATAARVREHAASLRVSLRCLGQVDLVRAIACLATRLNAEAPKLNQDGVVDIRQGRSPALLLHLGTQEAVVPLELTLGNETRTLVITGPNAGGKTVAMKTVGLLSVMIAYGIPVPMHADSSLCLFDQIMVEIGDNQSLEQDLSTFSARVQGLRAIADQAGPGTLILVDEIGTGTDPAEGAALAQATLAHCTAAGARTIATTHHGTLKTFAHEAHGVENGSMEFDQASLTPTFRFRQGLPGSSYAFLIAERLELNAAVLAQARALLGDPTVSLESLLLTLQKERKALSDQRLALQGRLVRSRILKLPASGAPKRAPQAREKKSKRVRRRPRRARKETAPAFIAVGAKVVMDGANTIGEVLAVEGAQVMVAFGSIRVQVNAHRLRPAQRKRKSRMVTYAQEARTAVDLRGLRVHDAVRAVEKLLDDAARADLRAVQILHGKGSGALREAIHAYLAAAAAVQEYSSPNVNPGITYVRLA